MITPPNRSREVVEAPSETEGGSNVLVMAILMAVFIVGVFVGGVACALLLPIDWSAVGRFVAPTAYETRPIEELIERPSR